MLHLFIEYHRLPPEARFKWALRHNIAHARLKLFVSLVIHLTQRVGHNLHRDAALDVSRLKKPSTIVENRLRLILTWTFSDNLLVQQPKTRTTTSNEVQVNPLTPLTSEQVQKLLPPDFVKYSFDMKGKRVYSAAFSGIKEEDTLYQILNDLMIVSEMHGCDLVWIDQRNTPSGSKEAKRDGLVVFGVSMENDAFSETYEILKGIFPADQLKFSEIFEGDLHYGVLVAENVSKKQTKLVNQLSALFNRCLSLQLLADADPKLTVCNCAVDESVLYLIFTGELSPIEPCKVSSQTISEQQIISFPPDTVDNEARSLIEDHPIGYRLLATYGLGYKDK